MKTNLLARVAGLCLAAGTSVVLAGPVLIDGTDSNDHGSFSAGVNQAGWEYIQKGLANLGSAVNPAAAKVVTVLGTTSGSQARNAIQSAFNLSGLAGWTIQYFTGDVAIGTFLDGLSTANTGILYLGSSGETSGDMTTAELAMVNSKAAKIGAFVGGAGNAALGGALFSHAENGTGAYGWLTTLIPGIVATDLSAGGIGTPLSLTAAGSAAFPGLSNADLSTGPWHGGFSGNLGGLSVLATGLDGNTTRNVIIGGGAGTVISCGQPGQPACPTPEPGVLPLVAAAAFGLGLMGLRRRKST